MGFWSNLLGGPITTGILSPWTPSDTLMTFAATELLGDMKASDVVTRDVALKVPGVKRSHGIHCGLVAGLSWYQYDGDQVVPDQPGWLTSSASGVSPYLRWYGIASDLFMSGWACLSFTSDMSDALHIPQGLWKVNSGTGVIEVDARIPEAYRAKPVAIALGYGDNGILVDGVESIRASRSIERAWNERVKNPAPATELHINDPAYNGITKTEKQKLVDE